MSVEALKIKARKHWEQWLPRKVAVLRMQHQLNQALQTAANQAQEEILNLMAQGFKMHEAEEVALPMFILLPPEPESDPEEKAELAAREAEYQKMMRPTGQSPDLAA